MARERFAWGLKVEGVTPIAEREAVASRAARAARDTLRVCFGGDTLELPTVPLRRKP
jgi:hypothetical protein